MSNFITQLTTISSMNSSLVLFLISLTSLHLLRLNAQNSTTNVTETLHPFHPSLTAIIGVMSIMLSIFILVIAYAKFCHRTPFNLLNHFDVEFQGGLNRSGSNLSGIDKITIDKIPVFRFSSLRGSKQGLECSVCLSAFEDIEILKLLPKCKHAFHRICIDQWLESHSSCPLCRQRFEAVDVTSFVFSSSSKLFQTMSNLTDDLNLELFIQREQDKPTKLRNVVELHKLKHKIIVSDVLVKHRWSDLNSSDLISLNSDMLNASSSQRFSSFGSKSTRFSSRFLKIKDDIEKKRRINESKFHTMQRSSSVSTSIEVHETKMMMKFNGKRSMSEIINVTRFRDQTGGNKAVGCTSNYTDEDERRRRRLWLPIARRTLQWFAGFDKSQQQPDNYKMVSSNV